MRVISVAHSLKNASRFSNAVLGPCNLQDSIDLRYRYAIERIRSHPVPKSGMEVSFEDSTLATLAFSHGIFAPCGTHQKFTLDERYRLIDLKEDALNLIRSASPELYKLVTLMTTDLVFVPSDNVGGGTGSQLPGVICVSPDSAWTERDLAESLVHEATHLSTFLADMVFGLYQLPASALEADECRVMSAVRVGKLRPLDKALHSGLVTVPLMYFQCRIGESYD